MDIESDQLLLLAVVATGITLLLGVLVIAVRTRRIRAQLLELDALKRSVQRDFTEIARISDRTFIGLQELSGFGLHFREIKREQLRLSEKLKMISSEMEALVGLLQLRGEIGREHQEKIKELVEASRSLQEWRSRMTAVYSDAGDLFESEPIRELIDQFGAQHTYAAEPPGRSERRTRPSQKRVRPRRQR